MPFIFRAVVNQVQRQSHTLSEKFLQSQKASDMKIGIISQRNIQRQNSVEYNALVIPNGEISPLTLQYEVKIVNTMNFQVPVTRKLLGFVHLITTQFSKQRRCRKHSCIRKRSWWLRAGSDLVHRNDFICVSVAPAISVTLSRNEWKGNEIGLT